MMITRVTTNGDGGLDVHDAGSNCTWYTDGRLLATARERGTYTAFMILGTVASSTKLGTLPAANLAQQKRKRAPMGERDPHPTLDMRTEARVLYPSVVAGEGMLGPYRWDDNTIACSHKLGTSSLP
jgi:hypothetical protein